MTVQVRVTLTIDQYEYITDLLTENVKALHKETMNQIITPTWIKRQVDRAEQVLGSWRSV